MPAHIVKPESKVNVSSGGPVEGIEDGAPYDRVQRPVDASKARTGVN